MARRTLLGCLSVAALGVCALTACKDSDAKGDAGTKTSATVEQLMKRCEELGKTCGDNDKHKDDIADECKQVARKQAEKGCTDSAIAVYECYQKQVCGKGDKIWVIEDLRVLADRYGKCVAERHAGSDCVANAK